LKGKAHASIGLLTYYNYSILNNIELSLIGGIISLLFSILPDLDHFNSIISRKLSNKKIESYISAILFLAPLVLFVYLGYLKKFDYSILFFLCLFVFIVIRKKIKISNIRKTIISSILFLSAFLIYNIYKDIYASRLIIFFAVFPWFTHRTFSHSLLSVFFLYLLTRNLTFIDYNISTISVLAYVSHLLLGDIFTFQGVALFWPISKYKFKLNPLKNHTSVKIMEILIITTLLLVAIYLTYILFKYKTPQQILLGSSIFKPK